VATRPPRWFNELTLLVLSSPVHWLADPDVCGLSFHGRRTGQRIELPVLYAASGDALVVLVGDAVDKRWWRNFIQPRRVTVRSHGRRFTATGRLVPASDPDFSRLAEVYRDRHRVSVRADDRLLVLTPVR
jgi:hypothetical protein